MVLLANSPRVQEVAQLVSTKIGHCTFPPKENFPISVKFKEQTNNIINV